MRWLRRKLRSVRRHRQQSRPSAPPLKRQKLVHLGGGPKLLDARCDQIALSSARQSGKLDFKPKSLLFETLFECVGLRTISWFASGALGGCRPGLLAHRSSCSMTFR
jgi:hypothetical protein